MSLFRAPSRLRFAFMLVSIAVAACSRAEPKIEENVFPRDYRTQVVDLLTRTLENPTNIHEAAVSEPALRPLREYSRFVLCVRYNPMNEKRVYQGLSEHLVYFYAGQINQFLTATREQCSWANYQPFPELERICLGQTCKY